MQQRTIRMPASRVRSRPAVAVGLAGLLVVSGVLAGCESEAATSGGSSASPSVTSAPPSPSASASSPSASASPSVAIPAAARVKSDKGAEAFVRYFFDQVNQSWTTPDPKLIEANSEEDCKSCASLRSTAEELKKKGHKYAGTPVKVMRTKSLAGAPAAQHYVEAELLQNRVNIVDSSGRVVSTDKRDTFTRTVAVIWKGDRWLIYDVA
jgi:Family of unknown function (DUF6318)